MSYSVITFYQFTDVPDPHVLCGALTLLASQASLKGTLILAREGINGTLSGKPDAIATFIETLRDASAGQPCFDGLELKFSHAATQPFGRLKIRVKPEIVTLGEERANPANRVGTYIAPRDWNAILADPAVTLVDVRNSFEVRRGSFPGAINPGTERFGEFPAFVAQALNPHEHRKIAMFCTGGIRCEKATALLLAQGFKEVLHLKGGILAYLEHVPAEESRWQGDCFVFDERIALGQGLVPVKSG